MNTLLQTGVSTADRTNPVQPVKSYGVLIVEDEFIIADNLRTILLTLGFTELELAHSVEEALLILGQRSFDLVLLDIKLQDERDGVDLAQEITIRYQLPFIFITSFVDERTLSRVKATHPYGYVVKPFKATDIQAAVELALYRHGYEQLSRQEQERRTLLHISTAIATIRDKDELFSLLMEQIKPLIGFDNNATIFLFDEPYTSYQIWLHKLYQFDLSAGESKPRSEQPIRVSDDPLARYLIQERKALIIDMDETQQWSTDAIGAQWTKQVGSQQALYAPLQVGGKLIGFLSFDTRQMDNFTETKLPFVQAVADQVAVAVANILANEEILKREQETALQLAVTNALTEDGSWDEKLLRVTRLLQPVIPFDYIAFTLEDKQACGRECNYLRIGLDEYQTIDTDAFLRIAQINARTYQQLRDADVAAEPELANGDDFLRLCKKRPLKNLIAQTFGFASNLLIPLSAPQDGRYMLSLFSRKPDVFTRGHLELLKKLAHPLTLCLERLLAFEQVQLLKNKLELEKEYLQEEVDADYNMGEVVGTSQAIRTTFTKVNQVAPTDSTVLIQGETGTGKELIARAIHNLSRRGGQPLIKINCAALPANLIESELFGHERGAFTGALDRRIGKFELANGSTLFLDEIGELPLELQAKLLRVIQEREIERLGSNKLIKTDVRLLAATNRDLAKEVAAGRFRSDLYFRLNVFPISLPPLRERKEDIPLLAVHFIQKLAKKLGRSITGIASSAIKDMQAYSWPGNIRELEHILERAAITTTGNTIKELALPQFDRETTLIPYQGIQLKTLADNERELIIRTLQYTGGRIRGEGGAAQILDIEPNTLDARMRKLGIVKKHVVEGRS